MKKQDSKSKVIQNSKVLSKKQSGIPKPKTKPKGLVKKKYIETSEKMWELFLEYKKKTKENPFVIEDWVGGFGTKVNRKKERPLTIEGFENYCANQNIIQDLSQYFANTEGRYGEYQTICSRIRKTIRQEQIEGGMAGMYNPSITQRLNSLKENVIEDTTIKYLVEYADKNSSDNA
jgi:DNA-packaging protein gp3